MLTIDNFADLLPAVFPADQIAAAIGNVKLLRATLIRDYPDWRGLQAMEQQITHLNEMQDRLEQGLRNWYGL